MDAWAEVGSILARVGDGLVTGAAEGSVIIAATYFALPHFLIRTHGISRCFDLLDECGRLGHLGAVELRAGRPDLCPEGQVNALRYELGRALQTAFGSDDEYRTLAIAMARFAKTLEYAERRTALPDFDAGMLIRRFQSELHRTIERFARRSRWWRLLGLASQLGVRD